jgi:hypothetical protein
MINKVPYEGMSEYISPQTAFDGTFRCSRYALFLSIIARDSFTIVPMTTAIIAHMNSKATNMATVMPDPDFVLNGLQIAAGVEDVMIEANYSGERLVSKGDPAINLEYVMNELELQEEEDHIIPTADIIMDATAKQPLCKIKEWMELKKFKTRPVGLQRATRQRIQQMTCHQSHLISSL